MKDMLDELVELLVTDENIASIQKAEGLKSYQRLETLANDLPSITISPTGPPEQDSFGSNKFLSQHFVFQVSIETIDRKLCKTLQKTVEMIFMTKGFYQMPGGLDEYFNDTKRYVDARFYQGNSRLYENY
ncbi:hypothetical protein ACFO26_06910 [Lactococcus nasutitermitis]|uniref:Phage protein n=1 Tax=Lactococcus nasutitermitis TaxID=1652957 RepID=A0ABV9JD06_9LACT|nr:hypothetical protein [Lactococcus nasutitermitis]